MLEKTVEEQKKIRNRLMKLLQEKQLISCRDIKQHLNVPLTGSPFFLTDVGMVYLLFEIEKAFEVRILEEELLEYGFSTIDQITGLLCKKLC